MTRRVRAVRGRTKRNVIERKSGKVGAEDAVRNRNVAYAKSNPTNRPPSRRSMCPPLGERRPRRDDGEPDDETGDAQPLRESRGAAHQPLRAQDEKNEAENDGHRPVHVIRRRSPA
jgi:hypothetical protein